MISQILFLINEIINNLRFLVYKQKHLKVTHNTKIVCPKEMMTQGSFRGRKWSLIT